ncbi:hypothetical protein B0H17DRAFT_1225227 [Mycena rosella]|uniref:Uncharacterized protein n=1 Tax=Mycena rosella TaxID=1033263 RepID=A0AAD7GF05_MYCRO|nr:hypothetical protein B0H17DRAFT_1225227 [Mycena rosella]
MMKENCGEWQASLPQPWVESSTPFRHPAGVYLMFKSDAKKEFGLTEAEILTLRHESVTASPKTYFALADAKVLQQRKFAAGALLNVDVKGFMRVLKSTISTGCRCKANFSEFYNRDARVSEHIYGANGRIAKAKAAP